MSQFQFEPIEEIDYLKELELINMCMMIKVLRVSLADDYKLSAS